MKTMHVKITFIDSVLGTASGNPEVHSDYIASKAPDAKSMEEEVAAIGADGVEQKQMTVFPRDQDGNPIFWNYQIKGTKSSGLKAYKKQIDLRIFVFPDAKDRSSRDILIHTNKPVGVLQRPLRASTAQGERVALASSEMIEAGAWCEFDIVMLNDEDEALVREWLDYGSLNGLGCWRNASHGAFIWEESKKAAA